MAAMGNLFPVSLLLLLLILEPISNSQVVADGASCGMLPHPRFILFSKRVVTPSFVGPAAVLVESGVIKDVRRVAEASEHAPFVTAQGVPVLDFGNAVVSPGLVDIHVHLNEPGRVEWEGVETGTKAAAAGGVTTLVDMPLNSMPTVTSKDTLHQKLDAIGGKLAVDMGFWGGLVPENAEDISKLQELLKEGVLGLKSFMCPSGINDFPDTNTTHFKAALPLLAQRGLPLLVHAEVVLPLEEGQGEGDPRKYSTYESSRPPAWEREAIRQALEAFAGTAPGGPHEGAKLHIVHLADAASLDLIQAAKASGTRVTVETCPHYLALSRADVADGDTRFKCAPPLRGSENRIDLWHALKDGKIDLLSSDHSPCTPDLKLLEEGNFLKAWGGISGLQLSLPVVHTHGLEHNVRLTELAQWWSSRPAAIANLGAKGEIAVGKDADFVVWMPEEEFQVEAASLFHKHKVTPYAGMKLTGRVLATFVRGQLVYQEGQHSANPCGKVLLAN